MIYKIVLEIIQTSLGFQFLHKLPLKFYTWYRISAWIFVHNNLSNTFSFFDHEIAETNNSNNTLCSKLRMQCACDTSYFPDLTCRWSLSDVDAVLVTIGFDQRGVGEGGIRNAEHKCNDHQSLLRSAYRKSKFWHFRMMGLPAPGKNWVENDLKHYVLRTWVHSNTAWAESFRSCSVKISPCRTWSHNDLLLWKKMFVEKVGTKSQASEALQMSILFENVCRELSCLSFRYSHVATIFAINDCVPHLLMFARPDMDTSASINGLKHVLTPHISKEFTHLTQWRHQSTK